jgi:hypothetical protein
MVVRLFAGPHVTGRWERGHTDEVADVLGRYDFEVNP